MTAQTKMPAHYRIRINKAGMPIGRYEATAAMRAVGLRSCTLGPDCDRGRAQAEKWNAEWDVRRKGHKASDATILAAGWRPDEVEHVRAGEALEQIQDLAYRFENSAVAAYVVKALRKIARDLDQHAKLAAANKTPRDFLHVASASA
jgi:hypothetical protein